MSNQEKSKVVTTGRRNLPHVKWDRNKRRNEDAMREEMWYVREIAPDYKDYSSEELDFSHQDGWHRLLLNFRLEPRHSFEPFELYHDRKRAVAKMEFKAKLLEDFERELDRKEEDRIRQEYGWLMEQSNE